MRLGQLARKLNIETKQIVKFLEKESITIENHLNTKLDDNQIELVTNAFPPEPEIEEVPEVIEESITKEESTVAEQTEEVPEVDNESEEDIEEEITVEVYEIPEEEYQKSLTETEDATQEAALTVTELIEKEGIKEGEEPTEKDLHEFSREEAIPEDVNAPTIRAPKVELQGIKVVGKIELPEKEIIEEKKAEGDNTPTDASPTNDDSKATLEGPAVHPNKVAKLKERKKQFISVKDLPKEEEVKKPKKAKEIKLEKKAQEKKNKKKKRQPKTPELSPEALAKQKLREKRRRQRQNTKEAASKNEKHWLKRIWDAIK